MSEQFTKIDGGLLVRAPGKINLSLLVKGKRADGYHDIESIMAKIGWYDEIFIEREKENVEDGSPAASQVSRHSGTGKTEDRRQETEVREEGNQENVEHPTSNLERRTEERTQNAEENAGETPATQIELICKGEYKVPEGEENLVYKAAEEILKNRRQKAEVRRQKTEDGTKNAECRTGKENAGETPATQLRITLTKHMPAGSGLGSGSSDAAATLIGINKFLNLGLSKKKLRELAAKLGSDVAFFLDGPAALCTGRGEKVKKLEECEFRVFLVVPNVSVSTKRVYENYRHDEGKYRRLSEEINIYIEKKRLDLICGLCANMLQESCFALHPELGVLKKRIESLGIRPICLSGSGSSMYCIINDRNEEGVRTYQEKLSQESGCRSIIVNNNTW